MHLSQYNLLHEEGLLLLDQVSVLRQGTRLELDWKSCGKQQLGSWCEPAGERGERLALGSEYGRKVLNDLKGSAMRRMIIPTALFSATVLALGLAGCSSQGGSSAVPSMPPADSDAGHEHAEHHAESSRADMDKMKAELAKLSPEDHSFGCSGQRQSPRLPLLLLFARVPATIRT